MIWPLLLFALNCYNRPFTFLGIGPQAGPFVKQAAAFYPDSVFAIIDETPIGEIGSDNVIWMKHRLLASEAADLSACEHVDVLYLSEPFPDEVMARFRQMAHCIVIQTPQGERLLEGTPPFRLTKSTLLHPKKRLWRYEVCCDYDRKTFTKTRLIWTRSYDWIPGINLITYLMYNGAVPSREQILAELPLNTAHNDWAPNNMIIQGKQLFLIDQEDPLMAPVTYNERFHDMQNKVRTLITITPDLPPSQVREKVMSIFGWGAHLELVEVDG